MMADFHLVKTFPVTETKWKSTVSRGGSRRRMSEMSDLKKIQDSINDLKNTVIQRLLDDNSKLKEKINILDNELQEMSDNQQDLEKETWKITNTLVGTTLRFPVSLTSLRMAIWKLQ